MPINQIFDYDYDQWGSKLIIESNKMLLIKFTWKIDKQIILNAKIYLR